MMESTCGMPITTFSFRTFFSVIPPEFEALGGLGELSEILL